MPVVPPDTRPVTVLPDAVWRSIEVLHAERADALTAGHRARRRMQQRHPVEDFLWTYYSVKPGELRRWHPGAGIVLQGAAEERGGWRHYATDGDGTAHVDLHAFFAERGGTVDYVERLIEATKDRAPQLGCFGLHEWAMVYRLDPGQVRHAGLPLRIGHEATDRVVESHRITCTHFDAFRFFTAPAEPLNTLQPTRETQPELEQPGCLHAGMDLYKWAAKLGPIVPGELLLDAFVLARDIREVDMRASPYDVTGYPGADGQTLAPIPIETADGKREYAALQRGFADRGNGLRARLIAAIRRARELHRDR
ncbi:MAG: 3-methyladenine DNA glycosylase [Actinobacteria bacterium]|nr:3-methyladenine DNA glycosylase [Actinomycetota bacterium]